MLREFTPHGSANVRRWLGTINDDLLWLSVATLFEKRRGAEMLKRRHPERAAALFKSIEFIEEAFIDRIVPLDVAVVREWARLLGARSKDRWDLALAATARVHGPTLITHDIKDFADRGVPMINPFENPPRHFDLMATCSLWSIGEQHWPPMLRALLHRPEFDGASYIGNAKRIAGKRSQEKSPANQ